MKTILSAIDFSEASLNALKYAIHFADETQSELKVLTVYNTFNYSPSTILGDINRTLLNEGNDLEKKLDKTVKKLCGKKKVNYKTYTAVGIPEIQIMKFANRHKCDIVCVGQTGNNLVQRFFMGSTTTHIINASTKAVLVVPPHAKYKTPKNILFTSDLDAANVKFLKPAITMSKFFNAKLTLLYIDTNNGYEQEQRIKHLEKLINRKYKYSAIRGVIASDLFVSEGIETYLHRHHCDVLIAVKYHPAFDKKTKHGFSTAKFVDRLSVPMLVFENKK